MSGKPFLIQGILVRPDERPKTVGFAHWRGDDIRSVTGIEDLSLVRLQYGHHAYVEDEGLYRRLEPNLLMTILVYGDINLDQHPPVVGPALVFGDSPDGEEGSVLDTYAEHVLSFLLRPEAVTEFGERWKRSPLYSEYAADLPTRA